MPKLYLIASEEREGLVKIGFTEAGSDAPVEQRVREYATGIADNARVYETDGARLFEAFLHGFFSDKRKPIMIRFKSAITQPREWFELPSEIADSLTATFDSEKPTHYSEVDAADLRAFFSGVLTAASWHAQQTGAYELALQQLAAGLPATRPATYSQQVDTPSPIMHIARQADELHSQVEDLRQAESARALISAVAGGLILLLLLMGAGWQAGVIALLTFVAMYYWSRLQPIGAAWLLRIAQESRDANSRMDENA